MPEPLTISQSLPGQRSRTQAMTRRWAEMPTEELVSFVRASYTHRGGQMSMTGAQAWDGMLPAGYEEWVEQTFTDVGFGPVEKYKYWISTFNYDSRRNRNNPGWLDGFPHKHSWDHGVTLVLMVQPSVGGETVLFEEDGTQHELHLNAGDAVLIGGELEHGVRPVLDLKQRIVLIATAFVAKGNEWVLQ